eukprot:scaffold207257_cov31-Tisochrysis_lutea.AAC.1
MLPFHTFYILQNDNGLELGSRFRFEYSIFRCLNLLFCLEPKRTSKPVDILHLLSTLRVRERDSLCGVRLPCIFVKGRGRRPPSAPRREEK